MTDTDKLVEEAMAACDKAVKEDDVMLRVPFEAILRDLIDAAQGLVWEKAEKGIKKAWANQDPIAIPCPECKGKGIDNTKSAIVAAGHACYPPCPTCSATGTLTVEEFARYQWEQAIGVADGGQWQTRSGVVRELKEQLDRRFPKEEKP